MTELIDAMASWIQSLITALGLPGIALAMFLETVFPPIPSELIMPLAGYTAARGSIPLPGAILAGTLGAVLGALVLYGLGRILPEDRLRALLARLERWRVVRVSDLDTALAFFRRHGEAVVFFGRLVALVRSLVSIPAGMARMRLGRFVLFTAAGTLIWNLLLGGAGYILGENWERVLIFLAAWEDLILVAGALAVIVFFIRRVRAK